jgi:CRISPR-associated endoribonuclease Cas6
MPHVVELRLLSLDNNPLPATLGYNSYALFLNILRNSCPEFASELHETDGPKPFTTATILPGYQKKMSSIPETPRQLLLRLTFLTDEVFAQFLKSALEWDNRELQLGSARFKVEQVHLVDMDKPQKNFCSYEELLSAATSEHNIALHFLSPTVFRSEGKRNVLFPEPELVFGSLLNRWNAFSPVKLSTELQQCFSSQILLARYKLETGMLNFGNYQETGFTGRSSFILDDKLSEQQSRAINALADFALYSGIGAKTTMGMGQTRRIKIGGALSNRARGKSEKN